MADKTKRQCERSNDHYWVDGDEVDDHCRRKPTQ